MAARIAAYVLRPTMLHAMVFKVDETGKPLGMAQCPVPVTPRRDPGKLAIRLAEYGEGYVETLLAIEAEDEHLRQRGMTPPVRPACVTVARMAFGAFGIEVQADWPGGAEGARHQAVLSVKGRAVAVSDLGHAEGLTPAIRAMLLRVTLWGHVDAHDDPAAAAYVVAGLVAAGRADLIRQLPELARWVRAEERDGVQIAEDYRAAVTREEEAECLRIAQWEKEKAK